LDNKVFDIIDARCNHENVFRIHAADRNTHYAVRRY